MKSFERAMAYAREQDVYQVLIESCLDTLHGRTVKARSLIFNVAVCRPHVTSRPIFYYCLSIVAESLIWKNCSCYQSTITSSTRTYIQIYRIKFNNMQVIQKIVIFQCRWLIRLQYIFMFIWSCLRVSGVTIRQQELEVRSKSTLKRCLSATTRHALLLLMVSTDQQDPLQ